MIWFSMCWNRKWRSILHLSFCVLLAVAVHQRVPASTKLAIKLSIYASCASYAQSKDRNETICIGPRSLIIYLDYHYHLIEGPWSYNWLDNSSQTAHGLLSSYGRAYSLEDLTNQTSLASIHSEWRGMTGHSHRVVFLLGHRLQQKVAVCLWIIALFLVTKQATLRAPYRFPERLPQRSLLLQRVTWSQCSCAAPSDHSVKPGVKLLLCAPCAESFETSGHKTCIALRKPSIPLTRQACTTMVTVPVRAMYVFLCDRGSYRWLCVGL